MIQVEQNNGIEEEEEEVVATPEQQWRGVTMAIISLCLLLYSCFTPTFVGSFSPHIYEGFLQAVE